MEVAVDAREALDGICEVDSIGEECDERARRDVPVHDLVAAEPDDEGDGDCREEFHRRRKHARLLDVLHHRVEIALIAVHETVDLVVLAHEGFHHARCGEALLQESRDLGKALLDDVARLLDLAPEDLHRLPDHRNDDEGQERELPVEIEHEGKRTDEDAPLRHHVDEVVHECRLDRAHVVRDIAHNLARLVAVIVRERHALELAEHDLADVDDDLLPDVGDEVGLPKIKNPAQEKDDDDADADGVQKSHVLVGKHVVDHVLDDPRDVEVRRRGEDDAHDRESEFLHVRAHIGKQSCVILHSSPTQRINKGKSCQQTLKAPLPPRTRSPSPALAGEALRYGILASPARAGEVANEVSR